MVPGVGAQWGPPLRPLLPADGVRPGARKSQHRQHGEGLLRWGAAVGEAEDCAGLWVGFWEVGGAHVRGAHPPSPSLSLCLNPLYQNFTGPFSPTAGVQRAMGMGGQIP